ncbi:hsp70-like protein [Coccidioides immitis RS]|uniref:Hsp70 nucleotide exchange factor FES1 n=2 Tax=Coccidioides TaxID=5500 RepID=FES1_COCIM|nr:hsp70-like protein [Coccidioides immitis RS]XP_003071082.1 HEAT repeat containing protein [Coccidioides posadasii C735 delta SOWgp]Q1E3S4.2 RecName: Full=Hsp70 nucleotide exchange factor FES1 [Coccidioides immitis RS]QVM05962.1 hsp70 nucleotide exchange factor fes1 [Coccidioides posadasii str. Silveira]EAS37435.3 hsp70-like protein [Coccidioides immitis RS]EER28937.1 HEAT repeat containing protein [Coccidioides posadasii C735 delta SOWgp]|eukprot:XP_003071082.1 HEAT repeat containing protein [Coccidioides posadasii C735 delta SOWgp]
MDSHMNNLLKWSIENSVPAQPDDPEQVKQERSLDRLDTQALQRLLSNAPSDADLMKAAMEVVSDDFATLENKLIAFDNFEQLIENLDNANNMGVLGLWTPLVEALSDAEPQMRKMAAWCIGTAVQNNEMAQNKLLDFKAVPKLLSLAKTDPDTTVRRKAIYALSSAVRNHQPSLDELQKLLPADYVSEGEKMNAADMDRIDAIMNKLKEIPA